MRKTNIVDRNFTETKREKYVKKLIDFIETKLEYKRRSGNEWVLEIYEWGEENIKHCEAIITENNNRIYEYRHSCSIDFYLLPKVICLLFLSLFSGAISDLHFRRLRKIYTACVDIRHW